MKRPLILIAAFALFFIALGYFIWRQNRMYRAVEQPVVVVQTVSQPLSPALPDTAIVTKPDFDFARLTGDSLHLYTRPVKSDSTLEVVLYKDELDDDYVQLIAQKGNWYQNEDSLWFYMDEAIPFSSKDKPDQE